MSDFYTTQKKIQKISLLLNNFMKITGNPWIRGLQVTQWSVFLLRMWGEYMIPVDREAVWTRIPLLGGVFMHEFNMARDAGGRLPNEYPLEDGPINRNMPHVEQEYSESG